MAKGKKWVLVKKFDGLPKRSDLEIQEFEIPDVQDGGKTFDSGDWSVE